jgi:protein-tyrosine-phosphatase/predicted ATP-grasp superfamily ATP-dependent carboligase
MSEATRTNVGGKVLVLGEDARAFLSVIRSLGRKGIEVHVAWCPRDALALRSRYIRRIHSLPAYSLNDDSWKRELIDLCARERYDLVIPCNDQTLIPLQKHRDELATVGRFYTLPPRAFDVAFNKIETNELARSLGVKLPRETIAVAQDDADRIVAEGFRFPLVLKPEASFKEHDLLARNDVKRVHDARELDQVLRGMLARGTRVIVQELFIGAGAGVELLAKDGKILVALEHVRVHEPLTGGASSYRKTVPLNPELYDAAAKLMATLDYTGVAMVEFKINPATGDWILIEINGRFWGSLPLAVAAGVDFPFYLYEMLVRGRSDFPRQYPANIFCRNFYQDVQWLPANFRADKSDPTLRTLPLPAVASEIFNVLSRRERNDTLVFDDPMPGVAEIGRIFGIGFGRIYGMIALRALALAPVRRAQAARIRRLARRARSILFVCHGNICRSPFAEIYARKVLEHASDSGAIRVLSSGYFPRPGRCSPDDAQAAVASFGLSLASHRSSVVSERMVAESDLIFVFDRENYKQLIARHPAARAKTFYLGLLSPSGPVTIADPYGKLQAEFDECYRTIARAIDALAELCAEPRAGVAPAKLPNPTSTR